LNDPIQLRIPEGARTVITGTGVEVYNADGGVVRVGGKAVQPGEGTGWFFRLAHNTPPAGTPDGCAAVLLCDDTDLDDIAAWSGGYLGDDGDEEPAPCIGIRRDDGKTPLARIGDWITVDARGVATVRRVPDTRYPADRPRWLGPAQPWPCGRCGTQADAEERHVCEPATQGNEESR